MKPNQESNQQGKFNLIWVVVNLGYGKCSAAEVFYVTDPKIIPNASLSSNSYQTQQPICPISLLGNQQCYITLNSASGLQLSL